MAETTTFSCKDREGKPLIGDGPASNECADDICTFTNGMKKCEGKPEPASEDSARSRQARMNHEQWLSDVALRERYPSVDRIEAERQEKLQPVHDAIEDAERRKKSAAEARQGELKDALDFYPHGPFPTALAERVKSNAHEEKLSQEAIDKEKEEEKRINEKYDECVKRIQALEKNRRRP